MNKQEKIQLLTDLKKKTTEAGHVVLKGLNMPLPIDYMVTEIEPFANIEIAIEAEINKLKQA